MVLPEIHRVMHRHAVHSATSLRARYAVPGTDAAYAFMSMCVYSRSFARATEDSIALTTSRYAPSYIPKSNARNRDFPYAPDTLCATRPTHCEIKHTSPTSQYCLYQHCGCLYLISRSRLCPRQLQLVDCVWYSTANLKPDPGTGAEKDAGSPCRWVNARRCNKHHTAFAQPNTKQNTPDFLVFASTEPQAPAYHLVEPNTNFTALCIDENECANPTGSTVKKLGACSGNEHTVCVNTFGEQRLLCTRCAWPALQTQIPETTLLVQSVLKMRFLGLDFGECVLYDGC
eukprot:1235394-Rhodomonas_salina.1